MSYEDVTEGLNERFATVAAIAVILDHEPTAVHETPLIYSILDSFERSVQGTHVRTTYRTLHRLCLAWQDSATTEAQLRALVDAVPEAVEDSPKLGGRMRPGDAQIEMGEAGWVRIGETTCRYIDFVSTVVELSRYRGLGR